MTVAQEGGPRTAPAGRDGRCSATGAEQQRRLLAAARPAAESLRRGRAAAPPRLPPSCHFVSGADTGRERSFLYPFSLLWLKIKYPWPFLFFIYFFLLVETRVVACTKSPQIHLSYSTCMGEMCGSGWWGMASSSGPSSHSLPCAGGCSWPAQHWALIRVSQLLHYYVNDLGCSCHTRLHHYLPHWRCR